jgi:hypothetical protein
LCREAGVDAGRPAARRQRSPAPHRAPPGRALRSAPDPFTEAQTVAERDDITPGDDPADTTERRDWDLPPSEEPGDREPPAGRHGLTDPGPERALDSPAPPDAGREGETEPADESERRDWDMP